ncbi:glycosyl hydrolase [Vibrio albus]|uniref:Glycosyl hydrolase n=1 Tax=Vibrio albus TaxID=2200953 RepID=A0A2U3B6X8_9VIBR|nr:glycoside hydrolase family 3 C-terminal domain-containing protein [Vibrio albus]PWI32556.1 glycosyl hydrolase [Vibrio albus]
MSGMQTKPKLLAILIAATAMTACSMTPKTNPDADLQYRENAQAMLQKLSLEEKLNILSGPGIDLEHYRGIDATNLAKEKNVLGVAGYINGVKNDSVDIPAVKLADGPAGLRIRPTRDNDDQTYYATAWPIGSLLASSWDTDLVQKVGAAEGNEVKEYGVDFLLAPGMNIQRNPLLGRNFEYYSEDPLLSGKIAAAMVSGVQSNDVGATIKHFVANNAETNRFFNNTIADPRTLREIYLRGFQIAVEESQPWAIMSSYNLVNGTYVNQRKDIMNDILRGEWNFSGLAMSDWFAGNVFGLKSDFRGRIERDQESAAKQVTAGNDLIEPGGVKEDLAASVSAGTLTEADVDKSVVAILTQMHKTPSYNQYEYSNTPDLRTHAVLARQAAAEGMVLLKNEAATLPLKPQAKVASFGTTQINTLKGGTGSGNVNSAYISHIASALGERFTLNTAVTDFYNQYFEANKQKTKALIGGYDFSDEPAVSDHSQLKQLIAEAAVNDAAAVITIGRQAGEGGDRTATQGDYLLTDAELETISAVSQTFHAQSKPVTVVLNVNGLVDTTMWGNKVDSILLAYMGGQETGHAIADILVGDVNPSGKLAQTVPVQYSDVPSASTFPGKDIDDDGMVDASYYNEGLYVGYRYYSSFDTAPAYPFGYGLSYTNFEYRNPHVVTNTLNADGASGKLTLSVTIANNGKSAGKEVAQVYISAPEVKLEKPVIELKAFDKTTLLKPGQTEELTLTIPAKTLASFDPDHNQWIVEPGQYQAYIAPSSDVSGSNFGNATKPVTFTINQEIVVAKTTPNALALQDGVNQADFVTIK